MNWPDARLCELLGIEHPVIQAPMAVSATPQLAAAVCNAGGLGSLGCASMSLEEIRSSVLELRAATNQAFNLNFFVHPAPEPDARIWADAWSRVAPWYRELGLEGPPQPPPQPGPGFDDGKLALLLELQPRAVSFHFGVPDEASIQALKEAGTILLSTATTVAEAKHLEQAGIDAIIAQGWEAGGHRGSQKPVAPMDGVGTMALVPQIVDAVRVPVIAAGGIADGRGITAALLLGASGVQIGTGFLRCPEAGTDVERRKLLAVASDTDTIVTDSVSGRTARTHRSRYTEAMEETRRRLPAYPAMYDLSDPLTEAGQDDVASFHLYGQAAALARELPAGELISILLAEASYALRRGAVVGSHAL